MWDLCGEEESAQMNGKPVEGKEWMTTQTVEQRKTGEIEKMKRQFFCIFKVLRKPPCVSDITTLYLECLWSDVSFVCRYVVRYALTFSVCRIIVKYFSFCEKLSSNTVFWGQCWQLKLCKNRPKWRMSVEFLCYRWIQSLEARLGISTWELFEFKFISRFYIIRWRSQEKNPFKCRFTYFSDSLKHFLISLSESIFNKFLVNFDISERRIESRNKLSLLFKPNEIIFFFSKREFYSLIFA